MSDADDTAGPIPFNRPFVSGKELFYIAQAVVDGHLAGGGAFTERCEKLLEGRVGRGRALLTHSCTAALEIGALLGDLREGDEAIVPSFTFVSTANAFALRGCKPVFVDIREDTLNLDERLVPAAVTERTRALFVVHYAGVPAEMDPLLDTARRHELIVIEDAAHGLGASYHGRPLGSMGDASAFSFHETKNIISGEGGALLVNREEWVERAQQIRDKGTNRSAFLRGEVDKYTWTDIGSSYQPAEIVAAFLYAQLENLDAITARRAGLFEAYRERLQGLEAAGDARLPYTPPGCTHGQHMFYLLCEDLAAREGLIGHLKRQGIHAVFHYVPLHDFPMGERYGYRAGQLPVTESISQRLVRLPMYYELSGPELKRVTDAVLDYFGRS